MATCTSVGNGDWTAGATWDTDPNPPANGDTVIIANTHTVTFDEDMSGWANGVTLTIDEGATLICKDDGGDYYLLTSADITVDGTLQAGTDTDNPLTGTFTIDFNNTAHSIERGTTGHLYLYCERPTIKYIVLDEDEPGGETVLSCNGYDVTSDIWAVGDTVCIIDSSPTDVQYSTIAAGGISADSITIDDVLDSAVSANSIMVLITRNIRIINVATSDYAITYTAGAGDGDYIAAEIYNCNRGITGGDGFTSNCTFYITNATALAYSNGDNLTIGGALTKCYIYKTDGITVSAIIAGYLYGIFSCSSIECTGLFHGNTYSIHSCIGVNLSNTCEINYSNYGVSGCSSVASYASYTGNARDFFEGTDLIITNTTLGGSVSALTAVNNAKLYNVVVTGTEFLNYNTSKRNKTSYVESFNHDGVENAYKAWLKGGIVTSSMISPPTGYDTWYELACEDTTQTYPCFYQYETIVLPGTSLEVEGYIRIADGEDLTGYAPALQIIDKFADPLVDDTQDTLDEDEIPDPDGSETGWQAVSVIWANQGDSPRQVIVRFIAYNDGGVDDVNVDVALKIANYQNQIATIYNKVKRLGATATGT